MSVDLIKQLEAAARVTAHLEAENERLWDALFDCFSQGCYESEPDPDKPGFYRFKGYRHGFLSAYENAQDMLLEKGIIKPEDCLYK